MLLAPSEPLNRLILGAVDRAQRRYGVEVHAFVFLSNHYHVLISVRDVEQMSRFVGYFEAKIAKEVARLTQWCLAEASRDRASHRAAQALEALASSLVSLCLEGGPARAQGGLRALSGRVSYGGRGPAPWRSDGTVPRRLLPATQAIRRRRLARPPQRRVRNVCAQAPRSSALTTRRRHPDRPAARSQTTRRKILVASLKAPCRHPRHG